MNPLESLFYPAEREEPEQEVQVDDANKNQLDLPENQVLDDAVIVSQPANHEDQIQSDNADSGEGAMEVDFMNSVLDGDANTIPILKDSTIANFCRN